MPFASALTGLRLPAKRDRQSTDRLAVRRPEEWEQEYLQMSESVRTVVDRLERQLEREANAIGWNTGDTVEARLGAAAPRPAINHEPTLLVGRKDGYRGGLLSVEHIPLRRFDVLPRKPIYAAADARRVEELCAAIQGRSGHAQDIPWQHRFRDNELRARSPLDWTVYAQVYDPAYPHRPYCEGPPDNPLSAKILWVLLVREAFSERGGNGTDAHLGLVHPRWVAHLRAFTEHLLFVAEERLKIAPDHALRLRYRHLRAHWCTIFDWDIFLIPLDYHEAERLWLYYQCKARDLLGIVNYVDSAFLRQYPFSSTNRPWTRNFVGVLDTDLPAAVRSQLMRDGVPVLRVHTLPGARPRDECLTDVWVQEELRKLVAAAGDPQTAHALRCDQIRRPDALDERKLKNQARPGKQQRERLKKLQKRKEAEVALDQRHLLSTEMRDRQKKRKSVADAEALYTQSSAFPHPRAWDPRKGYTEAAQEEAQWHDYPGYMPGAENIRLPLVLGPGTTSESMAGQRPSANPLPTPFTLAHPGFRDRIPEPFRSYAIAQEGQGARGPAPPMPHRLQPAADAASKNLAPPLSSDSLTDWSTYEPWLPGPPLEETEAEDEGLRSGGTTVGGTPLASTESVESTAPAGVEVPLQVEAAAAAPPVEKKKPIPLKEWLAAKRAKVAAMGLATEQRSGEGSG